MDFRSFTFSDVRIAAVQPLLASLAELGRLDVLHGAAPLTGSDPWKKGCTAPPLGTITARPRKTDQKEDDVGRGPNKPMSKRGSAFEKLQSQREEKGVEEDLERDEDERQERKQIRQEEREERKGEREKARGQEQSS